MKHASARTAIDFALTGSGFDRTAISATHLGLLAEEAVVDETVIEAGHEALVALPLDRADGGELPETGRLPDDPADLAAQLLPVIIDHPQQIGRQLARLWAITALWQHASWDERRHLRTAWLHSACSTTAPPESYITRQQLREWQREMPTLAGGGAANSAELGALLQARDARRAHYVVSGYLGAGADLGTLAKVLSTLCARLLLHRFDDQARIVDCLTGCIAAAELHEPTHLASLATSVGQLAHAVWWCAKDPDLKALKPGSDQQLGLEDAIRQGDMTAASRAARNSALHSKAFWDPIGRLLAELISSGHPTWQQALSCTVAMLRRKRTTDGSINPDQAAVIAATYAAVFHLNQRGSRPFRRDDSG